MQQIDIMPSVLEYLHYDRPFFALGNSVFDSLAKRYVITENNHSYWWLNQEYLGKFQDTVLKGLYRFPSDSLMKNDLMYLGGKGNSQFIEGFKAFLQTYHSALLENQLIIPDN